MGFGENGSDGLTNTKELEKNFWILLALVEDIRHKLGLSPECEFQSILDRIEELTNTEAVLLVDLIEDSEQGTIQ